MTQKKENDNEGIKKYIEKHYELKWGGKLDWENSDNLIEWAVETQIDTEFLHESRHWRNCLGISKFGSRLIGYDWIEMTGDAHIKDTDWTFNVDSLQELETYEVTVTKYKKKEYEEDA